jgi:hydroxymethylpyrimidine/phosphomethylpyrimidine kinase
MERPIVVTVGGWDPSGGAGLAADIKTMEMNGVTGMGVASAITFQSADKFWGLKWVESKDIIKQLNSIINQYSISCIKIGMTENAAVVRDIANRIDCLFDHHIPIVWDPVLKASAGYDFGNDVESIVRLLPRIDLLTPNRDEFDLIFGQLDTPSYINQRIKENNWGAVLLKGGHAQDHASDMLFDGKTQTIIKGERFDNVGKHGSGCVLSSAIASNLAKGASLAEACRLAKKYAEGFILSTPTLLGNHLASIETYGNTIN